MGAARKTRKICSVPVCERETWKADDMCNAHMQRRQKGLALDTPIRPRFKARADGRCAVDTCDRLRTKNRTLCIGHNERKRHWGDVRPDIPLRDPHGRIEGDTCRVEGCDRPRAVQRGGRWTLCVGHRARVVRTGDVIADRPIRGHIPHYNSTRVGVHGEPISYISAHSRIRSRRGKARDYICACGDPALEWGYRGDAEHEFSGDERGYILYWSGNPADYDPMCIRCHRKHDTLLSHLRWLAEVAPDMIDEVKRRMGVAA